MKRLLLLTILCLTIVSLGWGQTTIFTESMGTVGGTTTIAVHEANNGFDNDGYTMTSGGAAVPADIRQTSVSSGYSGATGGANVWFTSTNNSYGFAIEGIDASSYTNLTVIFGYRKESASALPTLALDYWDGISWVNVPFTFNEAANASVAWYLSPTISLPSGAQISDLKMRWVKSGTIAMRLDDVTLAGTLTLSGGITLDPVTQDFGPFCNNIANPVAITYTTSGTVTAPFVELSDASGSFASGTTNLGGIVTGGPSFTITADIPAAQTAGNLYRIRVVSTDVPAIISADNGSNIIINDPVTPSVTINDPGSVCADQSVLFTPVPVNLGGGTASYSWTINGVPDAYIGDTYTQSTWVDGNTVQAVMTVTGGCVTTTTASSNIVAPTVAAATPTVSIAITSGTNPACEGDGITFTATAGGLGGGTVSYQWKLNNVDAGSDSPDYTLSPDNDDEIYCVITVTGGCVTSNTATSNTITMTVFLTPATPVASSNSPVCTGGTLNLTSDATGTIAWTGPNGFNSAEQNPSIINVTAAAAGTYFVTSTVDGCPSLAGSTTVVIDTPPAITTQPASVSIYEGQDHTFTVVATGSGLSYKWFENNVEIPLTNSPSYTVTGATLGMSGNTYKCEVTGTCLPVVTSNSATLIVSKYPIAKWTFESVTVSGTNVTTPVISGSDAADFGLQTTGSAFTGNHTGTGTDWSQPTGNGSAKALSSNTWAIGDYYQFKVNTVGFIDISVNFEQTGSNTGPRDFNLQYSTDGISYTDFASYSLTNNTWNSANYNPTSYRTFDLSAITDLNAKSAIYFRLTVYSGTSIDGLTIGSGGTGRVDNFSVSGDPCTTGPCTIICNGNEALCTDTPGSDFYTVPDGSLDAVVACAGTYTISNSFNSTSTLAGAALPIGSNFITWTLVDECYNISTCTDTIIVGAPVSTIADANVCPDAVVYVDITVEDFLNAGAISMSLTYDPSQITYVGYTKNPALWDNFVVNVPGVPSGALDTIFAAGFADLQGPGLYLADDDVLFTLIFNQNGLTTTTDLNWITSGDFGSELWPYTYQFPTPYCDAPIEAHYLDGSVTLVDLPACYITPAVTAVCPNSSNVFSGPPNMSYAWSIAGNGGIPGPINEQNVTVIAGEFCYQSFTLTLIITDENGCSSTCETTVDVSPPLLSVTCPDPVIIPACTDQASIDEDFTSWLDDFSFTGGCSVDATPLTGYFAPDDCEGGTLTITFTATDYCGQYAECTSTFTVEPAVDIAISCPADPQLVACTPQSTIETAYTAWVNGFSFTGGCNASGNITSVPALPLDAHCNGASLIFNYVVTDDCGSDNCTATFTVDPAVDISLNACPTDPLLGACTPQADIQTAYNAWVAGFGYTGGCNASDNIALVPTLPLDAHCNGASLIFNYVVTDDCGSDNCTATFTVTPALDISLNACPADPLLAACTPQSTIETAYTAWVNGFSFTGGCNATDNIGNVPALPLDAQCNGASLIFNYVVTDDCGSENCTSTFTATGDAQGPEIITCAPAQSAFANADCEGFIPDFMLTTVAYDDCGFVLSQDPEPGTAAGLGNTTVTITATDCAGRTATCSTTFTLQLATISGTLKYNNPALTPMNNVVLTITPAGTNATSTTDAGGNYSFTGLCAGNYIITGATAKPIGYINSTDAAQVNYWNTNASPIEHVKFLSGEVDFDASVTVNATDALAIQNYFVFGTPFTRTTVTGTPWVFWRAGDLILSNFDANRLLANFIVPVDGDETVNIYAQGIGDFNGSFTPAFLPLAASSSLELTYNETRLAGAGIEIELPVRMMNSSIVGAVSLILDFPSDLMEVTGITMKANNGNLAWSVNGDELRIGWNSIQPLWFEANETLLNIRMKTSESFSQGEAIRFELASSPMNELADGSFNVIPDAVIGIDAIEFSLFGIGEPPAVSSLILESHPNPFAHYTLLTYNLPSEGHVTLQINDMLGRKVTLLVDEFMPGGVYNVKLDALPLQPGIYTATIVLHNGTRDLIRTIKLIRNW